MSQPPPPPPIQPPPGGFGGPPAYGYPQQPQAGFPPPPGTPPYPGAYPPGPFGPGFQGGPAGPGGPKGPGSNSKALGIVAAAVAVVVLIGVGGWFVVGSGDDGGGESPTASSGGGEEPAGGGEAKKLFSLDAPEVTEATSVPGGWAAGDIFAKSSTDKIIGTDVTDGSEAWTLPLKGGVCAASQQKTEGNEVALVVKETISSRADCNRLVLVDLDNHKIKWDKRLPQAESTMNENVAISGDFVATAWIGGAAGFRVSTGKQEWEAKQSTDCRDVGYAGGEHLVAVVECRNGGDQQFGVQRLGAKGKADWTFEVPRGVESVRVASTSPLVLGVGAGESTITDIMTVGEDKKLKARIPIGERYNKPCSIDIESCHGMAVGKDAVYLSTAERNGDGGDGPTNEVMAFDFKTGKTKWKSDAGTGHRIIPFDMQDDKILGYKLPGYQKGGEIVAIDQESGKQSSLLKMPVSEVGVDEQSFAMSTYSVRNPILFEDGRLFLQDDLVSKPTSGVPARKLAIGFGTD